jgi:phosphoglycolate phosphatase-like HAD superfamily hydrolase
MFNDQYKHGVPVVCFDIDGVLLKNPDSNDPDDASLPYMIRLKHLWDRCEKYREENGFPRASGQRDSLELLETTELGDVIRRINPEVFAFLRDSQTNALRGLMHPWNLLNFALYRDFFNWTEQTAEIAALFIQDSIKEYFELINKPEYQNITYPPQEGVVEFVKECKKRGYRLLITSGNPREIAKDKLVRAGLWEYFQDEFGHSINGDNILTRDDGLKMVRNGLGDVPLFYVGDRLSDVGLIKRMGGFGIKGVVTPSYRWEDGKHYQHEIDELKNSGKLCVLDSFSSSEMRNTALRFIEGANSSREMWTAFSEGGVSHRSRR